jgi:ComF family protein
MNNWLNKIQQIFYPYTCFICNEAGDNDLDLCVKCRSNLKAIGTTCRICGIAMHTERSLTCGRCLAKKPHFDSIITLYEYDETSKQLIQALKFNSKHNCARTMGRLMSAGFRHHGTLPDAILAVPLHKKRLRDRGFNQSQLIAQHLHQQLNIPLLNNTCTRTINTASQTTLKAKERRKNLSNAFSYNNQQFVNSIAVIDDVVTTGSTANEIAKTLKNAGVKHIEIWAFARA